ncbi:unnamed protein product [Paramecium primaurelia]|uniref:Tubulin-specific chaperone A n=2 Tax=Paramecium TaxID=5884 RepID=A0A8S1WN13_9CILI|nr:unnamed protein product [Paramecium primaurelia]CAD8189855.1 unnamed protein product [Paramecium pentaurelia]
MAEAPLEKKIKVLMAASRRIQKEYLAYKNEIQQYENIILGIEDNEENALKLKKKNELLVESKSMLPNTFQRLEENNQKLMDQVVELGMMNEELTEQAQQCIDQTQLFLNQINPAMI